MDKRDSAEGTVRGLGTVTSVVVGRPPRAVWQVAADPGMHTSRRPAYADVRSRPDER